MKDVWKPIFEKTGAPPVSYLFFSEPLPHPLYFTSGIADIAYVPPQPIMSRNDWPMLGEMIATGKRVVIFLDKGAESRTEPEADFILPQFEMVSHCPPSSRF